LQVDRNAVIASNVNIDKKEVVMIKDENEVWDYIKREEKSEEENLQEHIAYIATLQDEYLHGRQYPVNAEQRNDTANDSAVRTALYIV